MVSHSHVVCGGEWVVVLIDVVVLVVVGVPGWVSSVATEDCALLMVVVIHAALPVLVSVSVGCVIGIHIMRVLEGACSIL